MARLLVHGSQVLTGFRNDDEPVFVEDGAVLVEGSRVRAVGDFSELQEAHPDAEIIGSRDKVVTPGLVNAHHHVGLTPLQLGSPDLPLELWFASRLGLRTVDLYLDTLYSAFEMISSGVTTVQHLHSRVFGPPSNLLSAARTVIRAYRDVGMRASYSLSLKDQNRLVYEDDQTFLARLPHDLATSMAAHLERATITLEDHVEVFEELHREHVEDPLVRVQLAPSNLHWLSDRALHVTRELSERTGVPMHMHLLETRYQQAYARRRGAGSALTYVDRFGLTGPRLTIGHGVWMTDDDIDLCAGTSTRLCHNASSNLRLKSGVAPVNRFHERGIPVALGIDEAGINDDRDMLQEMRLVMRLHREPGIDAPYPSAASVLRMATEHGAGTTPFAGTIGELRAGASADLLLLDHEAVTYPYQSPEIPLIDVLVQRTRPSAVTAVMIAGEVVYRDGHFTRVDRDLVLADIADRLRRPLTAEDEARRQLAASIMPHVRQFYEGFLDNPGREPHYQMNQRA